MKNNIKPKWETQEDFFNWRERRLQEYEKDCRDFQEETEKIMQDSVPNAHPYFSFWEKKGKNGKVTPVYIDDK